MKKSEIYHLAQVAVLNSPAISPENKLEILHELMEAEGLAQYTEEREEQEGYSWRICTKSTLQS